MGAFPSAANQLRPPADPLSEYAKALSIKSMIGQQQSQVLGQQALGQENQLRQQQINDQQATTAAMHEWDGKSYDDLLPLIVKHGGSSQAVIGLKNVILGQQEKLSNIAKNDAETGAKNLETAQKKNDMLLGHLNALPDPSDPNFINALQTEKNAALAGGYLDKQHADMIDQLASTNDPQRIGPALDMFKKSLLGQKEQFDQAMKERDVAAKEIKEIPGTGMFYNTRTQEVTSPAGLRMPFPQMEAVAAAALGKKSAGEPISADEEKAIAGVKAIKTMVPAFNFNLQAGGLQGQQVSPAQKATSDAILEGRMSPPGSFALRTPYWQAVMGDVFQRDPQWSEQRAQIRKDFTVGKHSTEINAINTAMGHVGVLGDAIDALNNNDIKALNRIANFVGVQTGKDNVTTFNTIVHRVGPEIAKAYIGAGGSAGERGSDEKDFDPSLGPQQLKSNVGITAKLLRSKIGALENQWNQNKSDSMPSFQDRFITPEAKAQLDKWAPQGTAGVIYARDPQGVLHQAKEGTPVPEGWKQEKAPQ